MIVVIGRCDRVPLAGIGVRQKFLEARGPCGPVLASMSSVMNADLLQVCAAGVVTSDLVRFYHFHITATPRCELGEIGKCMAAGRPSILDEYNGIM